MISRIDGVQMILPQVVSGVVPQFEPYDIGFEHCIGYVGFCSQAPNVPGLPAVAQFFDGHRAYERACDWVDGKSKLYHAGLGNYLFTL